MLPPSLFVPGAGWMVAFATSVAGCLQSGGLYRVLCCAVLCRVAAAVMLVVVVVALAPPEWARFSTLTNTSFLHSVFTAA